MTPEDWYNDTIGRSYDTDNYPRSNPYQCWDYFDVFCRRIGCTSSRYCARTGYVGDLWELRYKYGYQTCFDFITPDKLREGDWVFWKQHVAFYYDGDEVGQNQNGRRYVSAVPMNWNGILGAMRYKKWEKPTSGVAEEFSSVIAGDYVTTAYLNLRAGGSTKYPTITTIPKGEVVKCFGYYHKEKDTYWLYVNWYSKRGTRTGFVCADYLERRYDVSE